MYGNRVEINLGNHRTEVTLGCESCPSSKTLKFLASGVAMIAGVDNGDAPFTVESKKDLTVQENGNLAATQTFADQMTVHQTPCATTEVCPKLNDLHALEEKLLDRSRKLR